VVTLLAAAAFGCGGGPGAHAADAAAANDSGLPDATWRETSASGPDASRDGAPWVDGVAPDADPFDAAVLDADAASLDAGPPLPACTKYVAASGAVNGNVASTTIQAGVNTLAPGDTLCVAPGTYNEIVAVSTPGTAMMPITVRALDPANRPIIDGGYVLPGGPAANTQACSEVGTNSNAHDGPYPAQSCFCWGSLVSIGASYVVWDGVDVTRSRGNGIFVGTSQSPVSEGIQVRGSVIDHTRSDGILIDHVSGLTVDGNQVHDTGDFATYDRTPAQLNWGGGIYEDDATQVVFSNNVIYHVWGEALGTGLFHDNTYIRVVRNTLYDNYALNLYVQQSSHVVVEQNLLYNSGDKAYFRGGAPSPCAVIDSEGLAQGAPPAGGFGASDIVFRNNILQGCSTLLGLWQFKATNAYGDIRVLNNTFLRPYPGGQSLESDMTTLTGFTFANNLVDATGGSIGPFPAVTGMVLESNLWSTTPPPPLSGTGDVVTSNFGLTNAAYQPSPGAFGTGVIRLLPSSPARDKGATLAEVSDDFFGTPRPQGVAYDIGADEYQ
jgi:hypothetical protein